MRMNQLVVKVVEGANAAAFETALIDFYEAAGEKEFVSVQFHVTAAPLYIALIHYIEG